MAENFLKTSEQLIIKTSLGSFQLNLSLASDEKQSCYKQLQTGIK